MAPKTEHAVAWRRKKSLAVLTSQAESSVAHGSEATLSRLRDFRMWKFLCRWREIPGLQALPLDAREFLHESRGTAQFQPDGSSNGTSAVLGFEML